MGNLFYHKQRNDHGDDGFWKQINSIIWTKEDISR